MSARMYNRNKQMFLSYGGRILYRGARVAERHLSLAGLYDIAEGPSSDLT